MSRVVMKFGGTSVADIDLIRNAANKVVKEVNKGHEVAVIVSAMAGQTNRLVGLIQEMTPLFDAREYDVITASGEQVTAGLMTLALQDLGVASRSWLGWQIPVHTGPVHGAARIFSIDTRAIEEKFTQGLHAVIAGFQGLGPDNRVSTLGRGGSDTSAVAIATALKAQRCDIYTDVDGVYTADPRIEIHARRIHRISYEEMMELASLGAKVLHARAVELAKNAKLPLRVLSSFSDSPGTLVCDEEEIMEKEVVMGVTHCLDEGSIKITGVYDKPGVVAAIFEPLADAHFNIDMIVQHISEEGCTDLTFSCAANDVKRICEILQSKKKQLGFKSLTHDDNVAKVSIVGIGMRSHVGVAQRMFAALARENINIKAISTSEIKVSVLVNTNYVELAVRALHAEFDLDKEKAGSAN